MGFESHVATTLGTPSVLELVALMAHLHTLLLDVIWDGNGIFDDLLCRVPQRPKQRPLTTLFLGHSNMFVELKGVLLDFFERDRFLELLSLSFPEIIITLPKPPPRRCVLNIKVSRGNLEVRDLKLGV